MRHGPKYTGRYTLGQNMLGETEQRQRALYASVAHEYDDVFPKHVAEHYIDKRTALVKELLPLGGRVLDVGCGTGQLAAAIASAAEEGDASAMSITEKAGRALAGLASSVIHRLWPEGGVVPVALSGGVLQGSAGVRNAFRDALKHERPEAAVSFTHVRPVLGALEIAAHRGRR